MKHLIRLLVVVVCGAVVYGCAKPQPSQAVEAAQPIVNAPARDLGLQPRHGDEIVVAGHYYRIGAPVVLWTDPGGYDAYRVERRFVPYEKSGWQATTQAMAAGDIEWVSKNQQFVPTRYGLRNGAGATTKYSAAELDQIRGGGWPLELLQKHVDQFVLHYDVCGTSQVCFRVLHDQRGLSVHFMLDIDGTIYQTLDLKERAWHATISNDRSIGIEIANIGSYGVNSSPAPLVQWYEKTPDGRAMITIPERLKGGGVRGKGPFYSRRSEPVVGVIQGGKQQMYDLTPQQYDSLIKLSAALCDVFPQMKPEAPRDATGKVKNAVLTKDEWTRFQGILGHYHVQDDKSDPGSAFDWDYFLPRVQDRLKELQVGRTQ